MSVNRQGTTDWRASSISRVCQYDHHIKWTVVGELNSLLQPMGRGPRTPSCRVKTLVHIHVQRKLTFLENSLQWYQGFFTHAIVRCWVSATRNKRTVSRDAGRSCQDLCCGLFQRVVVQVPIAEHRLHQTACAHTPTDQYLIHYRPQVRVTKALIQPFNPPFVGLPAHTRME